MKFTRAITVLICAGISAIALAASDVVAGAAAPVAATAKPNNRLGAELTKDMDAKQRQVAGTAQSLEMRERLLQATNGRLENKMSTMPPQQPVDTKAKAEEQKKDDESILQLVKVYQSMKPKTAARVFETLDLEIQVAVAQKMRSQALAKMMDAMSAESAVRLTTALARPAEIASLKHGSIKTASAQSTPSGKIPTGSPIAKR